MAVRRACSWCLLAAALGACGSPDEGASATGAQDGGSAEGSSAPAVTAVTADDAGATAATQPRTDGLYVCEPGMQYCDVTAAAGLDDAIGYGRGAAFVDVNSDGWDDLFVIDTDARTLRDSYGVSTLYLNAGDGTFTAVESGIAENDLLAAWGAAFGDYDNDGDPDVLIANGGYTTSSTLVFYENRWAEEGRFVDATERSGIGQVNSRLHPWWGVTWGDYDNDGLLDAAVTRRTGRPLILHNEGDGSFTERGQELGVLLDGNMDTKNPVFFDYDDDGDADLYIAGMFTHALFENQGDRFLDVTDSVFGDAYSGRLPYVFSAGAADFDQDGREDLYLGRWTEQDQVLHNLGQGRFELLGSEIGLDASLTTAASVDPFENTMGLGIGDLFNDGYPDVFIGTGDPTRASADLVFCNDGSGGFIRCTSLFDDPAQPTHTHAHAIVFSDVDNDGDSDVFQNLGGHPDYDETYSADSREQNKFFAQHGDVPPATAALSLEGTTSNRDAVGAVVRVTGAATHHYRVRSAQCFQAQNSRTLLVNPGDDGATVRVTWPGGLVEEASIRTGQRLHMVEGQGVQVTP